MAGSGMAMFVVLTTSWLGELLPPGLAADGFCIKNDIVCKTCPGSS